MGPWKEEAKAEADESFETYLAASNALGAFLNDLQIRCFHASSYAERISRCDRPENVEGPTPEAWEEINAHLGTTATCLAELVGQLGQQTFGRVPRVGTASAAAAPSLSRRRVSGAEAFGSDLNPVAGLLTWASLNLLGGGKAVQEEVMRVQAAALAEADRQVTEWGIEHNEAGERADALLYCVEVKPEGGHYFILSPRAGWWGRNPRSSANGSASPARSNSSRRSPLFPPQR